MERTGGTPEVVRRRSELLFRWFSWYARRHLARHFHAVRLSMPGRPTCPDDLPLIVVLNHPSWWDPMVCMTLTGLFPERAHFAPMDAKALEKYRFFGRLGFFPVDATSLRGAAAFLRESMGILARPGAALWVTAQGRFVDPRERPVELRPGVPHIAERLGRGTLLPLALEYPFWEERLPEALARFGEPIDIGAGPRSAQEWTTVLASRLEAAQDALAAQARARVPEAFELVCTGRVGVGGLYDLWRSLRVAMRGKRATLEHGAATRGDRP